MKSRVSDHLRVHHGELQRQVLALPWRRRSRAETSSTPRKSPVGSNGSHALQVSPNVRGIEVIGLVVVIGEPDQQ